jgi:carbon-monoxide dehydrogenase medium subunit
MPRFDLLQPTTVDEALGLLARHGEEAQLLGGGAMLMILLRQRLIAPRCLVSVTGIPSLVGARWEGGLLSVGAATTLRTLERMPEVRERYPVLAEALGLVGNVRVRNVATIGGHLAHADVHLDLPPVLVALDAAVTVRGPRGERRIPLDQLLVGYYETSLASDEMIVALHVPEPPGDLHGAYLKYCSLSPNDWPTVGVAAFMRREDGRLVDVRVVAGSVSPRPLRLREAESLLVGGRLEAAAVREVARRYAQAAEPLADVRGSAGYKRTVTEVYVRRAIEAAAARAGLAVHQG